MSKEITVICALPNGIHARPASYIKKICTPFSSSITWHNLRTGIKADAKSVLSLIGSNTLNGDECHIIISGDDEDKVFTRLEQFINEEFAQCDEPIINSQDGNLEPLPRSLANLNPQIIRAKAVCGGVSGGKLTLIDRIELDKITAFPQAGSKQDEKASVKQALKILQKLLSAQISYATETSKDILDAHLAILNDPLFIDHIISQIDLEMDAGSAIINTARYFSQQLADSGSEYLKERELDIQDVCFQLLQKIYGDTRFPANHQLTEPSICIAEELTPSQFFELDKKYLQGLILKHGGTTSHTVILARSFNIPTLVGADIDCLKSHLNRPVKIDGNLGLVAYDLSPEVMRYYELETQLHRDLVEKQQMFLSLPGLTQDAIKVEIAANIAHAIEAPSAFDNGAESIGLFRTEMIYMDRNHEPSEDELYNTFCQVIDAAKNRPIIIRTFDIGGDKPVDYLNIPCENNPFLGYRAVRIYQEFLTLFKAQLRAILRASAHGPLKIMIPMISSMEEILWVKEVLAEIKQTLRHQQIPFDEQISLGIMLEVPSIIFIIDQCCAEVDFFSIGSNDLTQYLMAVDRDNAKVTKHYNSLNPAFLRALDHIVKTIHHYGKWVGICGELASKGSVLPLLVGLGFDELSMSPPTIVATKARLAKLNRSHCRVLLNQAMNCRTSLEVEHLLAQFRMAQGDLPLISMETVTISPNWQSKEEVIKGMTDKLLVAERCRYPKKLAADIWQREDVFSTALGFGFAIPHTKSEHIEQSTISVTQLSKPISWGEEEVKFIIMLTLNKHAAGDQHMRIFSKLARRIMHDEFRTLLSEALNAQQIVTILTKELEI